MSTVFYPKSNHFGTGRMTALEGLAIEHRNTALPTNAVKSKKVMTLDRIIAMSPLVAVVLELINKILN